MIEMTMDDGFTFLETLIVLAITVILSAGIGEKNSMGFGWVEILNQVDNN